ncbi:MAG: bifunctional riboflavin kinase/FAD synthetase [Gammaproteobacteria bacterium]
MELIRGLQNIRPEHHGCVATIGNFDGVHVGHQAVLGQLAEEASSLGLPSVVITFEPYPQEFFLKENLPSRLTRFREKMQLLRRYAVDRVLCLRFDRSFASMKAENFIQQVLVSGLGIRYLVVGDDFRFGFRRQGDLSMLKAAGREFKFKVVNMHAFNIEGARVSSTRVRESLIAGEISTAEKLLGHAYRMAGKVAYGDGRGRTIGFPTANIALNRRVTPLSGVFAVEVFGIENEPLKGVANIGVRPTVDGSKCLLEVHLFEFDGNIYGKHIQIEFLKKIRDEKRFDSVDALIKQINLDVKQARAYFGSRMDCADAFPVSGY